MKRETRVNVIFLVAFLAISLPGAVILFRKKLEPNARRMDQPDVITTRLPYMTPLPVPPDVKWIVPDQTRAWLEQLTQKQTGQPKMLSATAAPQWTPVISPDHLVQVISVSDSANFIGLLIWAESIEPTSEKFSIVVDGSPATVSRVVATPIPQEVRSELVSLGFVKPPKMIHWVDVRFAELKNAPTRLELDYTGPPTPLHTIVEFAVK